MMHQIPSFPINLFNVQQNSNFSIPVQKLTYSPSFTFSRVFAQERMSNTEKNIFPIKLFNSWTNVMLWYLNSISINWSKSNMLLYFLWLSDLLSRKLNGLWPFFHIASFAYSIRSGQYAVLNDMKMSDIEGKVWSWSDIEWKKSMK